MIITVNENIVRLHGTIYSGDGQYITYYLNQVLTQYPEVTVYLHTAGGDVFDGNLIYNTLANSPAKIHMIIEGLAASMGSILMLAGNKISIADNGYVMTHAPRGCVCGTQADFIGASKLLISMEKTFLTKYSKKTKKPVESIKAWLQGDNWFSATEALEAGLVDEIIEPTMDDLDAEAIMKMDMVALWDEFSVKAETPSMTTPPEPLKTTNEAQLKSSKMKKELIAAMELKGVTEASSDTAVIQALQTQLTDAKTSATAKDTEIQALKDQIAESGKTAIKAAVTSAVSAGKITEGQREKYEAIGTASGIETLNSIFEDMTGKPASVISQITSGGSAVQTDGKSWDDLKKEKGALESLKANNPEQFNALYKAKFGKDFQ